MKILRLVIPLLVILSIGTTAMALPEMLDSFNNKYNTSGTALDSCNLCHIPGQPVRSSCDEECHIPNQAQKIDPVNLNPYGKSLRSHLDLPVDRALQAIEKIDSAGDKIPNIDKIHNLTFPGDKKGNNKKDNLPNNLTTPDNGNNGNNILNTLVQLLGRLR